MAWRLSRLRSRSDSPPQMPKRSSCASAYSRHSARTSQLRQTFFASRVEPPFSGKNASGSVCAHSARSCQPSSSASSAPMPSPSCTSGTMTSVTAHLLPPPKPRRPAPIPLRYENYMVEITPACLAPRQGEYVIMATCLTVMTGKSTRFSWPPGPVSGGASAGPLLGFVVFWGGAGGGIPPRVAFFGGGRGGHPPAGCVFWGGSRGASPRGLRFFGGGGGGPRPGGCGARGL